jgi:RimJ/RimL family protein N-acetyltransferase
VTRVSQQTLHTGRIALVPLADEHLEFEVELDADPEVMRYLTGRASTPEQVAVAHRRRLGAAVDGLGYWIGFVEGEPVGWWTIEPPRQPNEAHAVGRQAELGYRLLRPHWRNGLGSEGARELVRHGFADLHLDRIFAETMAVNTASRTTMASVGLRHVRTFHPHFDHPLPGSEHGEVEYAITREDWLAGAQ